MNAGELRRKKILENKEARLNKLFLTKKKIEEQSKTWSKDIDATDNEYDQNLLLNSDNDINNKEVEKKSIQELIANVKRVVKENVSNYDEPEIRESRNIQVQNNCTETINTSNSVSNNRDLFDISFVVLALLVRIAAAASYSWIYGETMWTPYVLLLIPYLMIRCRNFQPDGLFRIFILFKGSNDNAKMYYTSLAWFLIRHILQSFTIYMTCLSIFSFII